MRDVIDERINQCFLSGNLSSIKGSPEEGALVLAPFFEQNNQQPTYHRAIIIKPSIKIPSNDSRNIEYAFVRFVDYVDAKRFSRTWHASQKRQGNSKRWDLLSVMLSAAPN